MRVEPCGDSAYILRDLDAPAYQVADALNRAGITGLSEAVASYDTVGIYVDSSFELENLSPLPTLDQQTSKTLQIPVCYEMGDDLSGVAERLHLTAEEVIHAHVRMSYRCYAVGFCPGFPYLGYLDQAIAGLPRRDSPRTRVPVGSVAITGRQTGIYPLARPGGWHLIGRTPIQLVDVADRYFPIKAGDLVQFVRIDESEFSKLEGSRL